MVVWNTNMLGRPALVALVDWGTTPIDGVACAVRIEFARATAPGADPPEWLQFVMTPRAALELAMELGGMAAAQLATPDGQPH